MSYEDLGNLGEFISSILVLITLLVLVFQLRQAQKTISSTSYLESARLFFELFDEASTSEFLSTALGKSRREDRLTDAEQEAMDFFYRSMFRRYEALFNLREQGLIPEERLKQVGERFRNTAKGYPGVIGAWMIDEHTFEESFRAWGEYWLRGVREESEG